MGTELDDILRSLPERLRSRLAAGYTVTGGLGRGGMAVVLRARQEALSREVAIKVQWHVSSPSEKSLERAVFEAKTLAGIAHPNLPRLYEYWVEDMWTCLVCEYVEGEDLGSYMARRGPVGLDQALVLLRPVLEGLRVLHDRGIVHRDLKPANILLGVGAEKGAPGAVKLADLGLALGPEREFETQAGMIIGTPAFMSPEQIRGEKAGPRSDLYAFGIMLPMMLTGQHPLGSGSDREMLTSHLRMAPRPISVEVPRRIDMLIRRLLEKDSSERPADVTEVLAALEKVEGEAATQERTVVLPAAEVRTPRRDLNATSAVSRKEARTAAALMGKIPVDPPALAGGDRTHRRRFPVKIALAGLVAVSLTCLAGWFLLGSPFEVRSLEITLARGQVSARGDILGEGLEMRLLRNGQDLTDPVKSLAAEIPPGEKSHEPLVVSLARDGSTLLELVVTPPGGGILLDPFTCRLPPQDPSLTEFWALFTGLREEERVVVPGVIGKGGVQFHVPGSCKDWYRISLEKIEARRPRRLGEPPGMPPEIRVTMITAESRMTTAGIQAVLLPLVRRHREGKSLAGLAGLAGRVFDPAGDRAGDVGYLRAVDRSFEAILADPATSVATRIRIADWLLHIGRIHLWMIDQKGPPDPWLERLLNLPFRFRREKPGPGFDIGKVPADRIFGILPPPRDTDDVGTASTFAMTRYDTILAPKDGCPPGLEAASDVSRLIPVQRLQDPPSALVAGGRPIRLRIHVWFQDLEQVLTVRLGTARGPVVIDLLNPHDLGTSRKPWVTLADTANPWTWKNTPATVSAVELELPPGFFETGESPGATIELSRIEGFEHRAFNIPWIVGYDWLPGEPVTGSPAPGTD